MSTVVTTAVTDGRLGVDEKPNRVGGSTSARVPRSAPLEPTAQRRDPVHVGGAVPLLPSAPRRPAGPDAAQDHPGHRVGQGAPHRRLGQRRRHRAQGDSERRAAAEGQVQGQRRRPHPPRGAALGHGERLEAHLVEGVRRPDEVGDVLRRRQEEPVTRLVSTIASANPTRGVVRSSGRPRCGCPTSGPRRRLTPEPLAGQRMLRAGDGARDDQPLDLAGALEDREDLGVAGQRSTG